MTYFKTTRIECVEPRLGNWVRHAGSIVFLCSLLFLSCIPGEAEQVKRLTPNIVLIMADDLGYETIGANGNTTYTTPNLDGLAETGMRFTAAHSTPLCTPTRVQLMTGRYNFRNYIGFGLLNPEERTFAHFLKEAGYKTGIFGKWQLYGNPQQRELFGRSGTLPGDAGFDEHVLWQVQTKPGSRFKNPHIDIQGNLPVQIKDAYGPDVYADSLIAFVRRHRNTPFLAYYPMALTHGPFQPTPDHPDYAAFDPDEDRVNDTKYFASYVSYMDKIIGRIVDALDEEGLRENTLVLFIGDNGTDRRVTTQYEGREIQGNKGYTNQYGTHVPMIANWPGTIDPGIINNNLIDFTDFLPTLMDVAGHVLPSNEVFDGLSFYEQLVGEADSVRSWIFCHYAPRWGEFEHRRFVYNHRWKLYGDGTIYDVAADPEELNQVDRATLDGEEMEVIASFEEVLGRMH